MSHARSSAPAGTASRPLPATSMSRWRTSEVERGQLGPHRGGRQLAQHRRRGVDPAVQHAAPGHLDAEEDLLVRHREAHQVALLALQEPVPPERARDVGQAAERVVVERLGPHVHRVGPRGDPQVHPPALQLTQLRRDLADQHLALGIAAEAPRLRRQPVPRHDLRGGAREVAVDRPQRDGGAVLGQPRLARERPPRAPSRRGFSRFLSRGTRPPLRPFAAALGDHLRRPRRTGPRRARTAPGRPPPPCADAGHAARAGTARPPGRADARSRCAGRGSA